jgi:hypothetical protein
VPLERPMIFNGLTMNDHELRDWGIQPIGPSEQVDGADLDPGSVTTSVVTDGGMDVLQETQAAATNDTTIDFQPISTGDYWIRGFARVLAGSWTIELLRNGVVVNTISFNSTVYDDFDLGLVTFTGSDTISLRAHGPAGAFLLQVMLMEPRTNAPTIRWWVKLDKVDGLFDGDVRDERVPVPGQDGEESGDLKRGGKTITLTGRVRALDLAALREGQLAISRAFDTDEHALFWGMLGAENLYIRAKKNQKIDMPEQQTTNDYQRGFTIAVRADDPYSYTVAEKSAELVVGAVAGGLRTRLIQPVLLDYPIQTQPRTRVYANQSVSSSLVTVENEGPSKTYPVIEIYGPMEDPILTNVTSGRQLVWTGLTLTDGDFIVVDTKEGLILRGGVSEDYTGFDATQSDFFWLEPGLNDISIVPFSSGSGARAVVRWRDAY